MALLTLLYFSRVYVYEIERENISIWDPRLTCMYILSLLCCFSLIRLWLNCQCGAAELQMCSSGALPPYNQMSDFRIHSLYSNGVILMTVRLGKRRTPLVYAFYVAIGNDFMLDD